MIGSKTTEIRSQLIRITFSMWRFFVILWSLKMRKSERKKRVWSNNNITLINHFGDTFIFMSDWRDVLLYRLKEYFIRGIYNFMKWKVGSILQAIFVHGQHIQNIFSSFQMEVCGYPDLIPSRYTFTHY